MYFSITELNGRIFLFNGATSETWFLNGQNEWVKIKFKQES
jgi:hypothetical protein